MRVTKVYVLEFKLESVRRYLRNNRRLKETAHELGIPNSVSFPKPVALSFLEPV